MNTLLDILMVFTAIAWSILAALYAIMLIKDWLSNKSKKKMKDKRIRLKVEFIKQHNGIDTSFIQIFSSDEGLTECVKLTLMYAKFQRCKIKSMELLTTK